MSEKSIFEVDTRKAGAVAKTWQSTPAPTVITKKGARLTLNDLRSGQSSTNCSWKNNDHHSDKEITTVIFTNSGRYASTGVTRIQTEHLQGSVSRAKKPGLEADREASDKEARHGVGETLSFLRVAET